MSHFAPRYLVVGLSALALATAWSGTRLAGAHAPRAAPVIGPLGDGRWECWTPAPSPNPCFRGIRDVTMLGRGQGWAVGEAGIILGLSNGVWRAVASPTTATLSGVDALSADNAWAVGEGEALHWDGQFWRRVNRPELTTPLRDVSFVSSRDGWAVGDSQLILHWDGTAWQCVACGVADGQDLRQVVMISARDGWILGEAGGVSNTQLRHFDGAAWQVVPLPGTWYIRGLDFASASDGWAVGIGGEGKAWWSLVARWDGNTWTDTNCNSCGVAEAVAMASSVAGWAVGDGSTSMIWDGSAWARRALPLYGAPDSVALAAADDGWAADRSIGTLFHYDGEAVQTETWTPSVNAISLQSRESGWSVGAGIRRWDGHTWTDVPTPVGSFEDIAVFSDKEAWAVGRVASAHWDGTAWTAHYGNGGAFGVDILGPRDVWSVGVQGSIWHWVGNEWNTWDSVPSPTLRVLYDVDLTAPDSGWAVGSWGTILRWDGRLWTEAASPTTFDIRSLSMASPSDGWAVAVAHDGARRQVLHWDGASWRIVAVPAEVQPQAVTANAANDVWLVGYGPVAHFDGQGWQLMPNTHGDHLRAIAVVDGDLAWAAGWRTLQRWTPRPGPYRVHLPLTLDLPD